MPAMNVAKDEIDKAVDILDNVLASCHSERSAAK
jgi:hypothetical protein